MNNKEIEIARGYIELIEKWRVSRCKEEGIKNPSCLNYLIKKQQSLHMINQAAFASAMVLSLIGYMLISSVILSILVVALIFGVCKVSMDKLHHQTSRQITQHRKTTIDTEGLQAIIDQLNHVTGESIQVGEHITLQDLEMLENSFSAIPEHHEELNQFRYRFS